MTAIKITNGKRGIVKVQRRRTLGNFLNQHNPMPPRANKGAYPEPVKKIMNKYDQLNKRLLSRKKRAENPKIMAQRRAARNSAPGNASSKDLNVLCLRRRKIVKINNTPTFQRRNINGGKSWQKLLKSNRQQGEKAKQVEMNTARLESALATNSTVRDPLWIQIQESPSGKTHGAGIQNNLLAVAPPGALNNAAASGSNAIPEAMDLDIDNNILQQSDDILNGLFNRALQNNPGLGGTAGNDVAAPIESAAAPGEDAAALPVDNASLQVVGQNGPIGLGNGLVQNGPIGLGNGLVQNVPIGLGNGLVQNGGGLQGQLPQQGINGQIGFDDNGVMVFFALEPINNPFACYFCYLEALNNGLI